MLITIKNRWTNEEIISGEYSSTYEAMKAALGMNKSLRGANLRDADLRGADLRDADLSDANLRGADLSDANLRGANLRYADLCGADLSDADLCGANLRDADLRDADLSDANLRGANLRYADLSGANLSGADLCDADLSDANLSGADLPYIPKIDNIDGKILEAIEAGGALNMADWHTCETTHCRAGWAIHFAGEAGRVLESILGPSTAGALIYNASIGMVPNFYADNEAAMEDIRASAAKEGK